MASCSSADGDIGRGFEIAPDAIGTVSVELMRYYERGPGRPILEEIRQRVVGVPGVKIEVRVEEGGPPLDKDVVIQLSAPNYDELVDAAAVTRQFLETSRLSDDEGEIVLGEDGAPVPVFIDIEDARPLPGIDWRLEVDREQAGRFGANISSVGATIQLVTNGVLASTYRPDDAEDEVDIRVRFPEPSRDLSELDELRVQTAMGPVPISNFVTRVPQPKVDRINRRDGLRIIDVKGNANDQQQVPQNVAVEVAREWLESGVLGENVTWRLRGAAEESGDAGAFFQGAMMASLFLMAVILLTQFNSFYHTFLTLSAVVLSVVGVLFGLKLSGHYMSIIMTGTGIVALAGIVVNNNIVLIDTYQQVRASGLGLVDAVLRTVAQRLRPVLLTTITTICGLLPMVFQLNVNFGTGQLGIGSETSEMWLLISSAIVYGLSFATLLTLVLTPVMIAAPTILWERARGRVRTLGAAVMDRYREFDRRLSPNRDATPAE
ncbi:MAG: efflux RND transporter permease subunit [Pseudomonadota bacterium]